MTQPLGNAEYRRIEELEYYVRIFLERRERCRADSTPTTIKELRQILEKIGVTMVLWEEARADKPLDLEVA